MPRKRSSSELELERGVVLEACLLCGVGIIYTCTAMLSDRAMDVLKEDDFESHRKKGLIRGHVLVPSAEVTNANFSKFPWLASCYYRAGKSCLVEPGISY